MSTIPSTNPKFFAGIDYSYFDDLETDLAQLHTDLLAAGILLQNLVNVFNVPETPWYLAPVALGAGGVATIRTPTAGTSIRLKRIEISVSVATRIDLRWGVNAFESYYLPDNGTIIANWVSSNEVGAVNVPLTILSTAAATVTAHASGIEE